MWIKVKFQHNYFLNNLLYITCNYTVFYFPLATYDAQQSKIRIIKFKYWILIFFKQIKSRTIRGGVYS